MIGLKGALSLRAKNVSFPQEASPTLDSEPGTLDWDSFL